MSKLLPKSLVGQLLLFVSLLLLAAQAVNFLLLYRGAVTQNLVEASAAAVGRIAGELDRNTARNPERLRQLRRRRSLPLVSTESIVSPEADRFVDLEARSLQAFNNMGWNVRTVEAGYAKTLPATMENSVVGIRPLRGPRREAAREMGRGNPNRNVVGFILLSVEMGDGRWVSIASAVRDRNPALLRVLAFQTFIIYLVLLIPLFLFGRYVSRPLQWLTKSAQDFQPGDDRKILESGPPDIRQLIKAFNDMRGRVGAMLNEKDVMLGAIGHDLRTPLASLRVRVEHVEDDAERQRMIDGIEELDRTLDDILSLARIGRSAEELTSTDINALIETVVDEYSDIGEPVAFERGMRAVTKVRATLIRRALRNLIGNAVKYGKQATISVERDAENILINIDDNGPGIDEDHIAEMFEPFARAEKSRNRASGGSGLGLTLARAIARDHGGDIRLENREQGGLRAKLILPENA